MERLSKSGRSWYDPPRINVDITAQTNSLNINGVDLYSSLILHGYLVNNPDPSFTYYFDNYKGSFTWDGSQLNYREVKGEINYPSLNLDHYCLYSKVNTEMKDKYMEMVKSL